MSLVDLICKKCHCSFTTPLKRFNYLTKQGCKNFYCSQNWHRRKLTVRHSVEQVKARDKIKLDEIKKMGYDAYTIEDNGKFDSQFVNDEFKKFMIFIDSRLCSTTAVQVSHKDKMVGFDSPHSHQFV